MIDGRHWFLWLLANSPLAPVTYWSVALHKTDAVTTFFNMAQTQPPANPAQPPSLQPTVVNSFLYFLLAWAIL
jgi:hypothetical protein